MTTTSGLAIPAPPMAVHRFSGWEIRPAERLLLVGGQAARVGRRGFDVLLALVRREGRVATKAELLDEAWPGLVVEENNLSVQIAALRKLLGGEAIVNVSGIGYRLAVAPVASAVAAAEPPPRAVRTTPRLFGRDAELAALGTLLGNAPLVTVVGPGGVGKTALARALVADAPAIDWPDGVHWIDLAALADGSAVAPRVHGAFGVVDAAGDDELTLALAPLRALVVLDNCEHVMEEAAAVVAPLLAAAPGLHWLATSRQPLHVSGETVHRLDPLAVPALRADHDEARASAALAMLVARARSTDAGFDIADADVDAAIELCIALDGLPLAIEIAAARLAALGVRGVLEQVDQRLRMPAHHAPRRQRTLHDTFGWSYRLLPALEQRVFRHLAPFDGGFSAAQVQRLLQSVPEPVAPWQMLDTVAALVDKSLVQRIEAPVPRFRLLEHASDYAALCVVEEGEAGLVARCHAQAVAADFDRAMADFETLADADWNRRYGAERDNLRVALRWACSADDADLLARLVTALALLGQVDDVNHGELTGLNVPLDLLERAAPPLRARALLDLGWAHYFDGDRELGTVLVERSLALYETLADAAGMFRALMRLVRLFQGRPGAQAQAQAAWQRLLALDEGAAPLRTRLHCAIVTVWLRDGERCIERLHELHEIALRAGFDRLALVARVNFSDALLKRGRFDEVVRVAEPLLDAAPAPSRAWALNCHNLTLALVRLGRAEEARRAGRAVLRVMPSAAHHVADTFALAAARENRLVDAALLAGWADGHKRARDLQPDTAEQACIADTLALLKAQFGAARTAELMALGAAMAPREVLALALGDG